MRSQRTTTEDAEALAEEPELVAEVIEVAVDEARQVAW